jgi:hypothetical protein
VLKKNRNSQMNKLIQNIKYWLDAGFSNDILRQSLDDKIIVNKKICYFRKILVYCLQWFNRCECRVLRTELKFMIDLIDIDKKKSMIELVQCRSKLEILIESKSHNSDFDESWFGNNDRHIDNDNGSISSIVYKLETIGYETMDEFNRDLKKHTNYKTTIDNVKTKQNVVSITPYLLHKRNIQKEYAYYVSLGFKKKSIGFLNEKNTLDYNIDVLQFWSENRDLLKNNVFDKFKK